MKKFVVIVLLTILGFGIGYLIFGHVNGEYMAIDEMFKSRNAIMSGALNAVIDLSGKRMGIILSTVVGLGIGVVLAVGVMGKKGK